MQAVLAISGAPGFSLPAPARGKSSPPKKRRSALADAICPHFSSGTRMIFRFGVVLVKRLQQILPRFEQKGWR